MLVLQRNKLQARTMKKALQKMGDVQHNTSNWNQDAGQLKSMWFFFSNRKATSLLIYRTKFATWIIFKLAVQKRLGISLGKHWEKFSEGILWGPIKTSAVILLKHHSELHWRIIFF